MQDTQTLDDKPNISSESGKFDKAVKTAIKLMDDQYDDKTSQDNRDYWIQQLFETGFSVWDPTGTRKISSKVLYQAIWKTMSRMKPLDFTIHGTGRPPEIEHIVTAGVATVMKNGGYDGVLRDKNGAFQSLLTLGDVFYNIGTNPDSPIKNPIKFQITSKTGVYIDRYATVMRGGWGRSVRKMAVVYSFSWQEAIKHFPKLKRSGTKGRIPRTIGIDKDTERNWRQSTNLEDLTEVCYYYDLDNKAYVVFGGRGATVLEKKVGDKKYPFTMDGECYIPEIHYKCMPSVLGFYNHGIGDMLYDLALITQKLQNLELGHVEENTFPITLVNTPQGKSAKFFQKLKLAHKMRASGQKAYVAMEYDPAAPNGSLSADQLLTQNLANEWQMVFQMLEKEITRMGVSLDEIDRGTNTTATQILAEEDARNAFVKQIMENNASETEFAVKVTMDLIAKFVKKSNKTKLNLTTQVEIDGKPVRMDEVTLGMVADELKNHNYFVKINSRSGAIPSNLFLQAQVSRGLQMAVPGSPAHTKLVDKMAKLNDIDIAGAEFMPQQQAPPGPPGAEGEEGPPPITDTDREKINPRLDEPLPAI